MHSFDDIFLIFMNLQVMQEKYKTERERNTIIMNKLKTLYQQSAKVRHSQQHFAKLEKAHQAQAAYIQKLQTENQKIEVYKATIRTQERVVAKLEELIETKLKDRKDGGTSTTFRLKQEITRLTQRNQELEKKVFAGGAGGSLAIERVKELGKGFFEFFHFLNFSFLLLPFQQNPKQKKRTKQIPFLKYFETESKTSIH